MSKKSIIICLIAAVVFLGILGAAVVFLYNDPEAKEVSSQQASSDAKTLAAIPTDAAAVLNFSSLDKCSSLLSDPSYAFGVLISEGGKSDFKNFLTELPEESEIGKYPAALSLHYSGSLVPLMVLDAAKDAQDSLGIWNKVLEKAKEAGFAASRQDNFLLVSPSVTLVQASQRHIENQMSILDNKQFSLLLAKVGSRDAIFFSNSCAGKFVTSFLSKEQRGLSSFLKGLSDWVGFSLKEYSQKRIVLKGDASYGKNSSYFMNVPCASPASDSRFPEVLPSSTKLALSIPVADVQKYTEAYEKYLDAAARLSDHRKGIDTLKRRAEITPLQWAQSIDLKEVCTASWDNADNIELRANFIRLGKTRKKEELKANLYADFVAGIFGAAFKLDDESKVICTGDWLIQGSEQALEDWQDYINEQNTLKTSLSEAASLSIVPQRDAYIVAYVSPSHSVLSLDKWCSASLASAVRASMQGTSFAPAVLSLGKNGWSFEQVRTVAQAKRKEKTVLSPEALVEVPSGPFEVKNSGTGQMNKLTQNANNSLSLVDNAGKALWSIPFEKPLCGRVETIDYYNNGKLQFLFIAGDKLYLLDRLGRFVSGFPVSLNKEVLLGPAAYDFNGTKKYNILTLNKDNTIEMFSLRGEKPASWKGISCDETITSLPKLVKDSGKDYWELTTTTSVITYPFYGGEPVKTKKLQ